MTRKTHTTAMTHDPVTVRVRCLGSYHYVTWRDHRLVLENHADKEVTFIDLLNSPCRCVAILRSIRAAQDVRPKNIPPKLWEGVKASMDTLRHRYISPVIERRRQAKFFVGPIVIIRFSNEPPQITAWSRHAHGPDQRLAIHKTHSWEVDWKAVREYSESPYQFINALNWVIYQGIPGKPNDLEHFRSPEHRQRVFAAIARIFEVDLPDGM